MKIQIFSDLHIDVRPMKQITIAADVDLVIVAGDTCEGAIKAFEHLRRIVPMNIPIVMVLGNHEYYRGFIPDELSAARTHAPAFNIHLLENETTVLSGKPGGVGSGAVRIIGATLWTDYRAFGEASQGLVMNACAAGMNDHRLIGWQKRPWLRFRPLEAALMHGQSRGYIESVLRAGFEGPTIVLSHHAAHWSSIAPRFRDDHLTGAFLSDLSALIETYRPTIWVHGHVHNSSDYFVGDTRILCNPHGYGAENPSFDGALTIDIGK
ncbi:metallophosphoesterase [Bradyrhizobium sp. CSS354]|uniref:metallophosphoesterase n=1 Tax=Bradyrhizobium sp. CSS354 TaxID=2699172 RepID=UPI0023B0EC83|nr:metallophosphoesterase [Bradyrhizobium sp. CSS354]MDE5462212.1 metallophosphoesterase [Bradyrhizobium sp. CSS354]